MLIADVCVGFWLVGREVVTWWQSPLAIIIAASVYFPSLVVFVQLLGIVFAGPRAG